MNTTLWGLFGWHKSTSIIQRPICFFSIPIFLAFFIREQFFTNIREQFREQFHYFHFSCFFYPWTIFHEYSWTISWTISLFPIFLLFLFVNNFSSEIFWHKQFVHVDFYFFMRLQFFLAPLIWFRYFLSLSPLSLSDIFLLNDYWCEPWDLRGLLQ